MLKDFGVDSPVKESHYGTGATIKLPSFSKKSDYNSIMTTTQKL